MTFGKAFDEIVAAKGNAAMRLPKWRPDVLICVQFPDEHSKMTHPYLYVASRFGCVPWKETMVELFDTTWEVVHFPNQELAFDQESEMPNRKFKFDANANLYERGREME